MRRAVTPGCNLGLCRETPGTRTVCPWTSVGLGSKNVWNPEERRWTDAMWRMSTDTSREDTATSRPDRRQRFTALGYRCYVWAKPVQTEEFCRKCQGSTSRLLRHAGNLFPVRTKSESSEVRNMTVRENTRKMINIPIDLPGEEIFIRPVWTQTPSKPMPLTFIRLFLNWTVLKMSLLGHKRSECLKPAQRRKKKTHLLEFLNKKIKKNLMFDVW